MIIPVIPGPDLTAASNNPHLNHKIISRDEEIDFNAGGVINRQTNNCR